MVNETTVDFTVALILAVVMWVIYKGILYIIGEVYPSYIDTMMFFIFMIYQMIYGIMRKVNNEN